MVVVKVPANPSRSISDSAQLLVVAITPHLANCSANRFHRWPQVRACRKPSGSRASAAPACRSMRRRSTVTSRIWRMPRELRSRRSFQFQSSRFRPAGVKAGPATPAIRIAPERTASGRLSRLWGACLLGVVEARELDPTSRHALCNASRPR